MSEGWLHSIRGLFEASDEQAMWRVQHTSDHEAFAWLVQRWQPRIHRLCIRMLGDEHRGQNLTQETFLRLFAHRAQYRAESQFSSYLWRIALNLCHDEIRKRTRRAELPLEGYGALFLLNVSFPLKPAATPSEEKSEKIEDSEWERTRREIYGRDPDASRSGSTFFKMVPGEIDMGGRARTARYDAQRVEDLKRDLLETLKNAANLLEVKADEAITVVVLGPKASNSDKSSSPKKQDDSQHRSKRRTTSPPPSGQTTMSVRIKKSDAEAFAKGTLNLEEFRSRAVLNWD